MAGGDGHGHRGAPGPGPGALLPSRTLGEELHSARMEMTQLDHSIRKIALNTNRNSFQNGNAGRGRLNRNNFYNDPNRNKNQTDDKQNRKRPQETKTVFSRLSARKNRGDSDADEEVVPEKKPRISSQVIRDMPTKQEVLKAQSGDEVSRARNRRMFGSLLGTLQKFRQEEIVLKNKEEKKAQIEQKIELQAKQERENQKKERQTLFAKRELKKATIKALESKMARTLHFERWEATQKPLGNYIITRNKPHIYWLPKKMTEEAQKRLDLCSKKHEDMLEKKREELANDLLAIEQRCLRNAKIPADAKPSSLSASVDTGGDDENESNRRNEDEEREVVEEGSGGDPHRPIPVKRESKDEDKKSGIRVKREGERRERNDERSSDEDDQSEEDEDGEDASSSSEDDYEDHSEDDEDIRKMVLKNPKKEKDVDECPVRSKTETESENHEK